MIRFLIKSQKWKKNQISLHSQKIWFYQSSLIEIVFLHCYNFCLGDSSKYIYIYWGKNVLNIWLRKWRTGIRTEKTFKLILLHPWESERKECKTLPSLFGHASVCYTLLKNAKQKTDFYLPNFWFFIWFHAARVTRKDPLKWILWIISRKKLTSV